jgi:hypothetical protein
VVADNLGSCPSEPGVYAAVAISAGTARRTSLRLLRHGRPTVAVDSVRIAALRASGRTWTSIAQELGVGEGTVRRAAAAKNLLQIAPASALVPVVEPGHFDPPPQATQNKQPPASKQHEAGTQQPPTFSA